MGTPTHLPVLAGRVVELLAPALTRAERPVFVDATVGLGGHSAAVLDRCPDAVLVGVDRDPEAVALAQGRLEAYAGRITLVHADYRELPTILDEHGHDRVHGVLFDLGVSSFQLDQPERGFAYSYDAPLDMRMDPTQGQSAAELVNSSTPEQLTTLLREYGEERYARRIAATICRERLGEPITTSARLVQLIQQAVPAWRTGGHPAKRTFQALRIAVNDELGALRAALPAVVARLAPGGRLAVLAYHSLEDRLVKRTLASFSRATVPAGVPVVPPGHEPVLRLLTRGAERPGEAELGTNPRAASARLRAAERTPPAAERTLP